MIVNNINQYLAESYIELAEIRHEDIIFVDRRNQMYSTGFNQVSLLDHFSWQGLSDGSLASFARSALRLAMSRKTIDQRISALVDFSSFHIYVPHIYQDDLLFFSTNRNCVKISVIEEGDAAYNSSEFYDPFQRISRRNRLDRALIMKIFGLDIRLQTRSFFPNESSVYSTISTSAEAFRFYKNVIKKIVPFRAKFSSQETSSKILFISIGPLRGISVHDQLPAIDAFLYENMHRLKVDKVYLSLHPTARNTANLDCDVELVVKKHFRDFIWFSGFAEGLFAEATDGSVFVSIASSLFRYAHLNGFKCYSWLNYMDTDRRNEIEVYYSQLASFVSVVPRN